MQTDKRPYELLVRWDEDGRLIGAHVQWRLVVKDDDGAIVGEIVTEAEPADIGQGNGFPLADILSQAQADALAEIGKVRARVAELESQKAELEVQLRVLE